ncbi:endonuclease domain-containing protein [Streptomyces sp. NPDC054956]
MTPQTPLVFVPRRPSMLVLDSTDYQLRADRVARSMTPLLVEKVLKAKRIVDRERSSRCRACSNGTIDGVPACFRHMTADELEAAELLLRWTQVVVDRWLPHLAPVCWFWPCPDHAAKLGSDQLTAMFAWQQGRCAICGQRGQRGGTRSDSLVLDHDHEDGWARGFLCHPCNKRESLPRPGDGRFANYRRRPPAVMLGISLRYSEAVQLRVPTPRRRTAPSPIESLRTLGKIRRLVPDLEAQLPTVSESPKTQKRVVEEIHRMLQTVVPALLEAVQRPHSPQEGPDRAALADWLQQFPPPREP